MGTSNVLHFHFVVMLLTFDMKGVRRFGEWSSFHLHKRNEYTVGHVILITNGKGVLSLPWWWHMRKKEVYLHSFLISDRWGVGPASRPRHFIPGVRHRGTHWIGGWVCPTGDVVTLENTKFYSFCRELNDPSIVQPAALSLYWLSYRSSAHWIKPTFITRQ